MVGICWRACTFWSVNSTGQGSDATLGMRKKASLGFASYSKAEADAISNNDWMVIAVSKVTGMDYRDYFSMWGQAFQCESQCQVAGF